VDGMPLIWVAKLLGLPINERVAGSTLFDELSKRPREKKIKVFFFGGPQGVAEKAHELLNKTSKGMVSCGFYGPGFVSVDEMSTPDIVDEINHASPDFIVVALGAKKGQQWIQKNRKQLKAPVISHLGAVINFVAGSLERAPVMWQRLGLEWLWRIKQEPALWKRYCWDGFVFLSLLLLKVFPLAVYNRVLKRRRCFDMPCKIAWVNDTKDTIRLSGSFRCGGLKLAKVFLSSILEQPVNDVVMDFSDVSYVDAAFIASLMLFQSKLQKQGKALSLNKVPNRIKILMLLNNVYQRFKIIS
jgi:N-acetylglucosaminyldiphosphoundecaprenol N-acetyl-beta-D-mannosaminyltransferase